MTITFNIPVTSLPPNNANFEVASHVSWESGSAYFAGPGDDAKNSIQFPFIAIPIASAIGIMFIAATRKGNSKNSNYFWNRK